MQPLWNDILEKQFFLCLSKNMQRDIIKPDITVLIKLPVDFGYNLLSFIFPIKLEERCGFHSFLIIQSFNETSKEAFFAARNMEMQSKNHRITTQFAY